MNRSRLLITGASGFIGRHVLASVCDNFDEVHAVARSAKPSGDSRIRWHSNDLLDENSRRALVKTIKPSHLLHLAWYAEPKKYWTSPLNLTWLAATLSLLQEFSENGGQRLVVAGTAAEYDWHDEECLENITRLSPETLYGAAKLSLSILGESFAKEAGFSFASARLFSVYGPHEPKDRLIPSVIRALIEKREAPCPSGKQARDFLFVQDMANALAALTRSDVSGAVNIGSGVPTKLSEIFAQCGKVTGRSDLIKLGAFPDVQAEYPTVYANTTKLTERVGWKPQFTLSEGIELSVRWWESQISGC